MSRVPDDDLRRLVSDPIEMALVDGASVESMATELLALRARVVGGTDEPDQDDPAAHDWSRCIDAAPTPDDVPRSLTGYACQGECRAPGAVAAAPPGDEDLTAWLNGDVATQAVYAALDRTDMHGVPDMTAHAETYARLRAGWRLVPPAPPPGHEDEAAVERAEAAAYDVLTDDMTEGADTFDLACKVARAALAAARGPRTPGSES